jgi:hypothetical protein
MRETRLILGDRTPDDFARGVHGVCGVMMMLVGAGAGLLGVAQAAPGFVLLAVGAFLGGVHLLTRSLRRLT